LILDNTCSYLKILKWNLTFKQRSCDIFVENNIHRAASSGAATSFSFISQLRCFGSTLILFYKDFTATPLILV